mmetsp:Transcript_73580/g.177574  ORF Transcript_73580/g.177574 Transcript_73580/m.177574 type:complete len:207 (+) Transcript_73580:449-1069(+)
MWRCRLRRWLRRPPRGSSGHVGSWRRLGLQAQESQARREDQLTGQGEEGHRRAERHAGRRGGRARRRGGRHPQQMDAEDSAAWLPADLADLALREVGAAHAPRRVAHPLVLRRHHPGQLRPEALRHAAPHSGHPRLRDSGRRRHVHLLQHAQGRQDLPRVWNRRLCLRLPRRRRRLGGGLLGAAAERMGRLAARRAGGPLRVHGAV